MAEESEKRTPLFDWEKGEFVLDLNGRVKTATGQKAAAEIIFKAQQTARGVYEIYADVDDPDLNHKYGSEAQDIATRRDLTAGTRLSELQRAMREAIIYDPWVLDAYNFTLTQEGDQVYADFWVRTIFDEVLQIEGVNLTNG